MKCSSVIQIYVKNQSHQSLKNIVFVKDVNVYDGGTKVGPTSGTQCVQLQAQHDDPLKLKFDENSWIFHLYLAKGHKVTILMRCGFICDLGVAVRGARKTRKLRL